MSIPSPVYFSPVISGPNEELDVSEPKLATNSTTVQSVYSWDHVPFGAAGFLGANAGLHNQVSLTPNQSPTPNTAAPANILFTKAVGALQQLFMLYPNGTEVMFPPPFAEFSATGTGYTQNQVSFYLAGLKFNFGYIVLTASSITNATISYGTAYNTQCLWVGLMPGLVGGIVTMTLNSSSPFPLGGFNVTYNAVPTGTLCYLSVGF